MIEVIRAGAQMTLQGAALTGYRHLGFPACGAADPLSMALANHLVGQGATNTALEISYGSVSIKFRSPAQFAIVGATADLSLNSAPVFPNETLCAEAGDVLTIGPATAGARLYLAVNGMLEADNYLGTSSTYLPARLGGYQGRRLQNGDCIGFKLDRSVPCQTLPNDLGLTYSTSFALRATDGPDLKCADRALMYGESFQVSRRANRMGVGLLGKYPTNANSKSKPSAAVFPGTLQVPPGLEGFLLLADAQTTGGYPHLLQVNRSDRHLLGQLKPGDRVQFLRRTPEQAAKDLISKQNHISQYVPDFKL